MMTEFKKNENHSKMVDIRLNCFFEIMAEDIDVFAADRNGVAVRINNNYMKNYKVKEEDVLGKTVEELEGEGVFYPSVTRQVLLHKKKVTLLQRTGFGEDILTTGVPVFDEEGEVEYVVSFPAIDIAEMSNFNQKYLRLNELVNPHPFDIFESDTGDAEFFGVQTSNPTMRKIYGSIPEAAGSDANIMITGETGVGKNLVANLIHKQSSRSSKPFIEINCSAVPEELVEVELFGYAPGAFTGALSKGQRGKVEMANGGTLFLDEIGEISLQTQKKLLQLVQEKRMMPVGGINYQSVDFRLIAATNKDLRRSILDNKFREDLFYRINVLPIHIPPLRERKEDIPFLLHQFLESNNKIYDKGKKLSEKCMEMMMEYDWPGNIRELQNIVERLVIIGNNPIIDEQHFLNVFSEAQDKIQENRLPLKQRMEMFERSILKEMREGGLSTNQMARELKIGQSSVVRKLHKYGIQ